MADRQPRPMDDWDEADSRGEAPPAPAFVRTERGWEAIVALGPAEVAQARQLLEARLSHLGGELAAIQKQEAPRDEGPRPQYGKRIGDHTSDAVETRRNVAASDALRSGLAEVRRALAKLDEGTFGRCDRCGGEIGAERLEVMPWAAECVACRGQHR